MKIPDRKATQADWLVWVDAEYPYDRRWEIHLRRRQPHERAPVGSPTELRDLHGVRDREQAAMFAALWLAAQLRHGDQVRYPAEHEGQPVPPPPGWGAPRQTPRREPRQQTIGDWANESYG